MEHTITEGLHSILQEPAFFLGTVRLFDTRSSLSLSPMLTSRHVSTTVVTSVDTKDFWAEELERSVKKIRRDFEVLYGTIHREMNVYYQKKMEEVQVEIEQSQRYSQVDYQEVTITQQTLQMEYEKVQHTISYEKETYLKLEGTYSNDRSVIDDCLSHLSF